MSDGLREPREDERTWCACFQAWQPQPNQCDANGCSEMQATVREALEDLR